MKKTLLIILCLIVLTGCNNKKNNDSNNEKITSEVKFISVKIANIMNTINNIQLENYELVSEKASINKEEDKSGGQQQSSKQDSDSQDSESSEGNSQGGKEQEISVTNMQYSTVLANENREINWDTIKSEIELINSSWSIIMYDLTNKNISENDIMEFSNLLNKTIINIENENKVETLYNLSNLYSYIPRFLNNTPNKKHLDDIEQTKSYIYASYCYASNDDWNNSTQTLDNAEKTFLNILNDIEYTKNKEYKINKTNLLLKDLKNSITSADKNLYFMKYKNLIETINTL